MQSITKMGAAANAAEASINRMAAGQEKVARSFQHSARSVREAERANQLYFQSQARIEKQQLAMMERYQAKQGLIQSGMLPGPGGHGGGRMSLHERASAAMMGYAGVYMAGAIGRGLSHFLDNAESERMSRQKMGMVGFKGGLMAEANKVAEQMTGKYRNLSRADVLEQLYEGVAIHGDAKHALENVEAQVKLASFLQAFQGGAHGHNSKEWGREVFAAIKSMEMYGVLNTHDEEKKRADIDSYTGAMMSMKALYGDQAKIGEYLTTQRRAGTSFRLFDENFRLNVLPALVQEAGGATTGQQAMTAYQTIAGGTKLRKSQMAMMKTYGLLEGERFAESFRELFKQDPTLAAADLVARGAKKYKMEASDPALIKKVMDDLGFIAPNRNMSAFFSNLIQNDKNIHKHIEAMKRTRQELEAISKGEFFAATTKAGAEAQVGAQMKNLKSSFGGVMLQPYIDRMNNMATGLNKASTSMKAFFDAHPQLAKAAGHGAVSMIGGLGAIAALAGVRMMLKAIGFGLGGLGGGAVRVAVGAAMGGPAGAAAATALMALPLLARTSPAHLATAGKAAADASHKMIAGMSKAGKAAEAAATGGWLGKLARFGLWGGLAAGAGMLAYSNRDSLASFGSGAMEFGRRAALFRLFSSETSDMLNNFFKEMKFDVPKLDFSSIQKAIETIAAALVKATERLRSHIMFQLGLRSFAEHYGQNGENIPDWATPAERAKIMGKIMADRHAEMFDDSAAGTYYNGWLGSAIQRGNNATFFAQPGFGQEVMDWGKLPGSGGAIPQAEAQREISVKTAVEGTINGSVKVEITGTVNGPVNGNGTASVTGAVQGSSNASRGESSPLNLGAGN